MIYHVTAERAGKWWVLQAQEAPGAISQVSRLDQADQIKEAIAFVAGVAEADVEIVVSPVLPESVREHLAEADRYRQESSDANERAAAANRSAARILHDECRMPLRDVGAVLGVSHQRAHQLVSS